MSQPVVDLFERLAFIGAELVPALCQHLWHLAQHRPVRPQLVMRLRPEIPEGQQPCEKLVIDKRDPFVEPAQVSLLENESAGLRPENRV